MKNSYLQNLEWRYATKIFDATKIIDETTLNSLLESLRLSPSSFGIQPWKFLVVNNPDKRFELLAAAYGQNQITEASHLIVLCAKNDLNEADIDIYIKDVATKKNIQIESLAKFREMMLDTINRMTIEQRVTWNKKQVYLASGFLMSACAQLNVDSCPMEGFVPEKVDEILDLKNQGLTATLLMPVGYRSDEDKSMENVKVRFEPEKVITLI